MGIYRRKGREIYEYGFKINGKRFHGVTQTSDKQIALNIYHQKRTQAVSIDAGFERKKIGLKSLMDYYLDEHIRVSCADRKAREVARIFTKMLKFFGVEKDAAQLGLDDIIKWKNTRLKEGVAKVTVDNEIGYLRSAYNMRRAAGDKLPLPMENYEWCGIEEKRNRRIRKIRIMDPLEMEKFLSFCSNALYRYLVFFYSCGLRPIEIRDLRWDDLRWDSGKIQTRRTKGGRDGLIPLPGYVVQMLSTMPRISDYIFGTDRGKAGPSTYRKQWLAARDAYLATARVKTFRPYDFRHSFVTYMMERGMDAKTIADLLGHTTTVMVDTIYSHITDDHKKQALELLPANIFSRREACYNSATDDKPELEIISQTA